MTTTNHTTRNHDEALAEYERLSDQIKKILGQIEIGLINHDTECSSRTGGHNWASVGDLEHYKEQLIDVRDNLMHTGEYAPENCQPLRKRGYK